MIQETEKSQNSNQLPYIVKSKQSKKDPFDFSKPSKHNKTFILDNYLSFTNCTSLFFGTIPITQQCYYCSICNPTRDHKLCKFCFFTCHSKCKEHNPDTASIDEQAMKISEFACYCGIRLKHQPEPVDQLELIPCNMLILDQILNVKSIWCSTHQIKICCICSVTCHKNCKIVYENNANGGRCSCNSEFHTNYNEIALTFSLNDYKTATGVAVWPIQILNILFSTKNIFKQMGDLFMKTMTIEKVDENSIDESFFPLFELFSNTLNRKFKTFYFDDELLNIFQFEKVCEFMFQLPSNKDKYFLVKFRLIFIILFLHLKKDYQKIKFLTSIDFLAGSILERQKFKYLLFSLNNPLNEEINEKYYKAKNNYIKKIALEEICMLMEKGMNFLSIEENQDEFEIGLRYLCFMLKRMMFNNDELTKLSQSLFSFCDKFFEYIKKDRNNIYGLLGIFNTLSEIFFMISVNYNDNAFVSSIQKENGKLNLNTKSTTGFIHTKNECGHLIYKMVLKSCDIVKRHYIILKSESKQKEMMIKIKKLENEKGKDNTAKLALPSNGGFLVNKIISLFDNTLELYSLADNFYYKKLSEISKEDIQNYFNFKELVNKNKYGNLFEIVKKEFTSITHPVNVLKTNIELLLKKLFMSSYTDSNLRIDSNIISEIIQFSKKTNDYFALIQSRRIKVKNYSNDISIDKSDTVSIYTESVMKKIKPFFPFVSHPLFASLKENFIQSLIEYSIDETITKVLVFFSNRNYPHLLSTDLLNLILSLLSIYTLSKDGMKYLLLGKNITRINKIIRRYSFRKDHKNIIELYHRNIDDNLKYTMRTLQFLYSFSKGISAYHLTIRNHKVLERLKNNILEHIECFIEEKGDDEDYSSELYSHLYLILKFFEELSFNYSYEEYEDIKLRLMNMFCYSKIIFSEPNQFVHLLNCSKGSVSKGISRKNTMLLITTKSDEVKQSREALIHKERTGAEREESLSGYESNNILNNKESFLSENNENSVNVLKIKAYFAFFELFSKNSFYVYSNSVKEELYENIFNSNDIEEIKSLFYDQRAISLKEKVILLKFLRTFCFLEHLDEKDFLSNARVMNNEEYKTMIYKGKVDIEGVEPKEESDEEDLDNHIENQIELDKKLSHIEKAENVILLFISELSNLSSTINSIKNGANAMKEELIIQEYLKEIIYGTKSISDFFHFSKNIVNKLIFRFYSLTKQLLLNSSFIIPFFNESYDLDSHSNTEILQRLSSVAFNIYDKDALYKIISEELSFIFSMTNIAESSLPKYLDVFDNMSEANFTPFSLIETYDYEYFYDDESKEEKEEISHDKIQNKLLILNKEYLEQFINITNTNFYSVITNLSNEALRIDYRKKIVDYFLCFLNSDENVKTFSKIEMLFVLIDKMLFYDGDESQEKFQKMKNSPFFFNYVNYLIHKFTNLTIISARNTNVFSISMKMISITKLIIQFLQLLGEGFNLDYHDNIFLSKNDKENEEDELSESYYDESDEEEEEEDESEEEQIESKRTMSQKSKKEYDYTIDESIYTSMIRNLKVTFKLMEISNEINAELPYDKLIVLTTNIIDFLIEYIDTTDKNCVYIQNGIRNLFFGNKNHKKNLDILSQEGIDAISLLHSILFTRIIDETLSLRRKIVCYIKIKYIQLLIAFLQTGKQSDFVIDLIRHRCSLLELFQELLFNFSCLIDNIKERNPEIYKSLCVYQSDESFVNSLIQIYMYENIFTELIEFTLCMKLYILIRSIEEIYSQNMLRAHFEKLNLMIEEKKMIMENKEYEKEDNKTDLYSTFALRIYTFMEKMILKVEIKKGDEKEDEDETDGESDKEKMIYKIAKAIKNMNEDKEEEKENDNVKKISSSYLQSDTRITFFIRPYLTFRLSEQSKKSFEENVNRESATSKFMELVTFSDYSLLEMIINEHLIGRSGLKTMLSELNYFACEIINFFFIIAINILIMIHYYRSPNVDMSIYDVVDEDSMHKLFPDVYLVSAVQIGFLVIVFLNWMYFKFSLYYQHSIMKRYNQNFIFRKKGQSHSENISPTIVEYFEQGNNMSTYSVIHAKNKDIGIFQALYVALFDSILFNREICILIYSIIFVGLYLLLQIELFLVVSTLFVANITPTLLDIFRAMTMKFSQMISVIIFIVLVVYLYMWITYFYMAFLFDFDDIVEISSGASINESFCTSSVQCFLFILQQGLRAGGGIGEVLPNMSFQTDPWFFIARFFYDMLFFIFIIMILFNVFMGIIVDTFAELRDMNWSRENDIQNICFICQKSRDDCLTKNIDFESHVREEHNLWNYVYFLVHLHINNPNDFNSIENFVWEKLEEQDYGWIPIDENAE